VSGWMISRFNFNIWAMYTLLQVRIYTFCLGCDRLFSTKIEVIKLFYKNYHLNRTSVDAFRCMQTMQKLQQMLITQKFLILQPAYVAGKVGVICGQEILACGQLTGRWLIQVDYEAEDIVLSLPPCEFHSLSHKVVNY
jgi:hypothetical protein